MTNRILVVAPHPDDEMLGCGGTLLRRRDEGAEIDWLIVTAMDEAHGWPALAVQTRAQEIEKVAQLMGFTSVYQLAYPTACLDQVDLAELVAKVGAIIKAREPIEVYVPSFADAHSDHRVVADIASACAKWFRYPSIKRILAYETLSETDFSLAAHRFRPNVFVDITSFLERKLQILQVYASELGQPPFPRSLAAVRALATLRGAASGFVAAESFELLLERKG